jgi:hypothetical protein
MSDLQVRQLANIRRHEFVVATDRHRVRCDVGRSSIRVDRRRPSVSIAIGVVRALRVALIDRHPHRPFSTG